MAIHEKMYRFFRKAGMTHAGASAMLSACQHESAFRTNNLEDTANREFGISDEEYTRQVIAGSRNFVDGYGYGFFQWTYKTRKRALLTYAAMLGARIDDEDMQLQFSIQEFKTEYEFHNCWVCLCTSDNVDTCAEIVTRDYERPANIGAAIEVRKKSAHDWANKFRNLDLNATEDNSVTPDGQPPFKYFTMSLPLLGFEREGPGVITLQGGLLLRGFTFGKDPIGYFGEGTKAAVRAYQESVGKAPDGIAGKDTFTEMMKM